MQIRTVDRKANSNEIFMIRYLTGLLMIVSLSCSAAGQLEPYRGFAQTPALSLEDLGHKLHTLQDYRGQVVLVNFWASWCPYCRHEMPAMEAFYRENKDKGFEIVAYSLDKTQAEADAYMHQEGYGFPAPLASPQVTAAFGGVARMPTSFVIDRRGIIRHKVSGQVHSGRLADLIDPLLAAPR
jgi:thiol-disulfide isomerase/thioredoxin